LKEQTGCYNPVIQSQRDSLDLGHSTCTSDQYECVRYSHSSLVTAGGICTHLTGNHGNDVSYCSTATQEYRDN